MRALLLLLATTALAQPAPQPTAESLRGASAVSQNIAWASGTHGTYLRTTDAGRTWTAAQVPDAATLDFRAVAAFSADEAFLMSAGPGNQSRIYHTADAGKTWQLQFTNTNPKGFFDSMVFWDRAHGIVLGDPIPDENGKLKFELLMTNDGQTWTQLPPAQLPPAIEGEGAFAASNSCIAILPAAISPVIPSGDTCSAKRSACQSRRTPAISPPSAPTQGVLTTEATTTAPALPVSWTPGASAPHQPSKKEIVPDPNIWFATGGKVARVFHSPDRGESWQVFDTPIVHGPDSAGIFSIAFRDKTHGVIAGGDYKHPDQDGPNLAFTADAGKTWTLSQISPQSYYSAVAYDRKSNDRKSNDHLFLVGAKSIYNLRPPKNLTPITPKNSTSQFNALSPYPTGGALLVGPKGAIATIP
jgi:photosystem II stability/assembly factor-like uncharacterized protein